MVRRFLITTALEQTWKPDEPVLFLGEWCRLYGRKSQWESLDAEVLPYHWDDRAKLFADYQYVRALYERLLADLSAHLNRIHATDHSPRYWRILVGPWLGYFIQILFDRWCSVQQAVSGYDLSGTVVLTGDENALVPNDMAGFIDLFLGDKWNHHVYALILQRVADIDFEKVRRQSDTAPTLRSTGTWRRQAKAGVAKLYARLASTLTRSDDAFFLATYCPFRYEMVLHKRLGQVPQVWRSVVPTQVAVDAARRRWTVDGVSFSEFEACARDLIPRLLPTLYLEGYAALIEQTRSLPWPGRPKLIWTSNSYNSDDVFKAWAAEKVECGSPLVIGQHGGGHGIHLWGYYEEHQIAISDRFLSWGWTEAADPKVHAVGQLTAKRPLGIRHADQPGALLVTGVLPRQSYLMYSVMVARQWLDYFDDQCVFVDRLPEHIRSALTVRLSPQDYGWGQATRWRDRFPGLRLDEGRSGINSLIGKSRLYIATYNATTYLESFSMDVPTVIYWNPNHWELRDSAIGYFQDLERAGIFHKTPESAADHVAAIWDDVDAWWSRADVQEAVRRFKARYCYLPDNLLDRVEFALRDVMAARPAKLRP